MIDDPNTVGVSHIVNPIAPRGLFAQAMAAMGGNSGGPGHEPSFLDHRLMPRMLAVRL